MSDIRAWLDDLGLADYAETFETNAITIDLASDLSDQDLKDLGVTVMGHRKALLRAIDDLATATESKAPVVSREAERRQITVMFCDLVGSTALSERLDPEDLRSLMQEYQKAAGSVIERYGGHVAQYLGDGLMTYFGWPQAHEDDAERAVRASLDIVEAVNAMDLQVRIGIATGPVVVGETGAGDASVPKLAVGETPNLAARLQGLAGPDEIVVGASTRRLLGGTFELDDLGEQALKGIIEPVHAHRITDLATTEGRFEARARHLTPLVGREAEMAMVMARWSQAKAGEGQVIVLSGEPGIGKSRITQALRERLADEPHARLRYQCSPYHTNSALHPVIEQLEGAAGFRRDDTQDDKLDKLERFLSVSSNDTDRTLAAILLSLPTERYPSLAISPQKQKEETLQLLADRIVSRAADAPMLLIFEDAHWIDPTSQELLDLVVPMLAGKPALAVITHRPEYPAPWLGQGHVTPLALNRLGRADAASMVAGVSDTSLPDDILDQIVARCDGVPLFVEELTKSVTEGSEAGVPETLQDSLMARLDRLGAAKEVAQIGACLGRTFPHTLLAAVSPLDDAALRDSLLQLIAAELIFSSGSQSEPSYTFKHALVQDVAYESMLKSKRHAVHGSIAAVLVDRFQDMVAQQPELVAFHYTEAGQTDPAIEAWLQAGNRAAARLAHVEAIAHLHQGLALLHEQPEGQDRDRRELDFQVALGNSCLLIDGYASTTAKDSFARALELCRTLGNPPQVFPVMYGLSVNLGIRGELPEAQEFAKEFVAEAEAQGDPAASVVSHRILGTYLTTTGDLTLARRHLERALGLYDESKQEKLSHDYGHDPRIWALSYLSQTLWLLGYFDRAREMLLESLARAEVLAHPSNLVSAGFAASRVHFLNRDAEATLGAAEAVLDTATEHGFPAWLAFAKPLRVWANIALGDSSQEIGEARDGIAWCRDAGSEMFLPICLAAYAEACRLAGRIDESREAVSQALAIADRTHGLWCAAELHRMQGEWSLADGESGAVVAEGEFRRAIKIAQSQEAKSWELRAATSLARLWQSQGKVNEAYDLLAPIYNWFTEGFDASDLKGAKALLDSLK